MKTISFYSYKGGVGRTYLTAQIARILAAMGRNVVVVDMDFDAPGVPVAFGLSIMEPKRGLFELSRDYRRLFNHPNYSNMLKTSLNSCEYLIDISIDMKGKKDQGRIRILPCAEITNFYWESLADREWIDFLCADPDSLLSLNRFISLHLIPTLKSMNVDYLLIDSRSGISQYGNIACSVANRQAIIFCPNNEAEESLSHFLLHRIINSNKLSQVIVDKLLFIVSRIPLEFEKEKNNKFMQMQNLINYRLKTLSEDILSHTEILALHSDIETQLDSFKRTFDERYKKGGDGEIVQLNEDMIACFIALCPEAVPKKYINYELQRKIHAIWSDIFRDKLKAITFSLFKLYTINGEMRNPSDNARNVSFKVETFINFLKNFHAHIGDESMIGGLSIAGKSCGEEFGKALLKKFKNDINNVHERIEAWCEFDRKVGFGLLKYIKDTNTLYADNLFILDTDNVKKNDYSSFFNGYVEGVLGKLLDNDRKITIKNVKRNKKSIKYELEVIDDTKN